MIDKNQPKLNQNELLLEVYKQIPEKPDLIKSKTNKTASISLNDCLACSGCVTTAESLLIEQHSTQELLLQLSQNKDFIPLFSISPQSRVSLAYHLKISELEVIKLLRTKLSLKWGVCPVLDMSLGLDLAVILSCKEFQKAFIKGTPVICSECPGWVCYAEKVAGQGAIPLMSKIKSPQQIIGRFIKELYWKRRGKNMGSLFHVAVMPCYDKKLEAVRNE